MRILVTGGLGYIGSHTCVELINNGFEVIVIDNLSNSSIEVLDKIKSITNKNIIFYEGDITDKNFIKAIFSMHQIDAVIHFAGLKSVLESIAKPIEYFNSNVLGSINLIEVMNEFKCKKIIFSSSATVYGNPISLPINENFQLGYSNPYGQTKLVIEDFLRSIYKKDTTWGIAILRYFNPVGAHKSMLIGESPKGKPNNLMPLICEVALNDREFIDVFGSDYDTKDGTGVRDYIHVVDLSLGHLKALEYIRNKPELITVNLGTGEGYSVLEMIQTFEKVSGKKIPFRYCNRREGDVAISYSDTRRAESLLNWKSKYNLHDMCLDTWNWIKNK